MKMIQQISLLLLLFTSLQAFGQIQKKPVKYLNDSIAISCESENLIIVRNVNTDKYGILDNKHQVIVDFEYDYIGPFCEGLAVAFKIPLSGYIDTDGKVAIPLIFTSTQDFNNDRAIVTDKLGMFGVINKKMDTIIPFKYNLLATHDHTTYNFRKSSLKSGIMNNQEEVLLAPRFNSMMRVNDSLWIGGQETNRDFLYKYDFTIYRNNGRLHNPDTFMSIGSINELGLISMNKGGKKGFLDKNYETIVPAIYDNTDLEVGDLIPVKKNSNWGLLNNKGEVVIDFQFEKILNIYSTGKAIGVKEDSCTMINGTTEQLVKFQCEEVEVITNSSLLFIDGKLYDKNLVQLSNDFELAPSRGFNRNNFNYGLMKIFQGNKLGYIDTVGNIKIKPKYDDGYHIFNKGCTAVKKDDKWGFINTDDQNITPIEYDSVYLVGNIENCDFLVYKNGHIGLFKGDSLIIAPQFDDLKFENKKIVFRQDDKYGIFDLAQNKKGTEVYDSVGIDLIGYTIKQGDKYGYIFQESGQRVPVMYDSFLPAGYFNIVSLNKKYGTISDANEIIEECKYDKITRSLNIGTRVYLDKKVGYLSLNGYELLPPIYDSITKLDWKNIQATKNGVQETFNILELERKVIKERGGK